MPTGHQNEPTGASAEVVYAWNLCHICCRQSAAHCYVLPLCDTLQNWDDSAFFHICHKGSLSQPFVPAKFENVKCNRMSKNSLKTCTNKIFSLHKVSFTQPSNTIIDFHQTKYHTPSKDTLHILIKCTIFWSVTFNVIEKNYFTITKKLKRYSCPCPHHKGILGEDRYSCIHS